MKLVLEHDYGMAFLFEEKDAAAMMQAFCKARVVKNIYGNPTAHAPTYEIMPDVAITFKLVPDWYIAPSPAPEVQLDQLVVKTTAEKTRVDAIAETFTSGKEVDVPF